MAAFRKKNEFNPVLTNYLERIESDFKDIPDDRIKILKTLGDFVIHSLRDSGAASLTFICTHNSRRSQFCEAWAFAAARHYGIEGIQSFSGGTESTAMNPRAVAALQRAGFLVDKDSGHEENPRYALHTGADLPASILFSKKYDDPSNPEEDFCAVMVCSDADEACPIVPGAAARISLPYDDPKDFDGTDLEIKKYDERCREIARDIFYALNYVTLCIS